MKIQKDAVATDDSHISNDREPIKNVSEVTHLGAIFTNNHDDPREIRRIAIAKNATIALTNINAFHL